MRDPNPRRSTGGNSEKGQALSEYIVVSLGIVLALLAAVGAVELLVQHHERASDTMQLPL